jgi:MFS family permease
VSADARVVELPGAAAAAPGARISRSQAIVTALAITETVSWGIVYYAFAVFLAPMREALHASTAQLTGAFSVALLISGVAGISVGRLLDRASSRVLMTAGSAAGAALVVAWSQVHSLAALYLVWAGLGFVMAATLYEPAFVVLAKWFPTTAERRRAMTSMTLVAALASFIFVPLSQALIDAYGWREALVILAAVLAVVTVPLHALTLRRAPLPSAASQRPREPSSTAVDALRSQTFWLLTAAFFLATLAATAMTVHLIAFLIQAQTSQAFAAFAVGLIGVMQIPGRLLFGPLAARAPRPIATGAIFAAVAIGVAVIAGAPSPAVVLLGIALLGMGNGMATLARATAIAELYGARAYGAIAGVAASATTIARAAGPVTAAIWAATVGYEALLWTLAGLAAIAAGLAYHAESTIERRGQA